MKQLSIIILLFTCLCCRDKPQQPYVPATIPCSLTRNIDTINLNIVGTWEFIEEKRYSFTQPGPIYVTPQTDGYKRKMVIGNDTLRYFKNSIPDSVYTYKIVKWKELTGTNFPEDEYPVIALYRLYDKKLEADIPIQICGDYLLRQLQFVTSNSGEQIWKRQ